MKVLVNYGFPLLYIRLLQADCFFLFSLGGVFVFAATPPPCVSVSLCLLFSIFLCVPTPRACLTPSPPLGCSPGGPWERKYVHPPPPQPLLPP